MSLLYASTISWVFKMKFTTISQWMSSIPLTNMYKIMFSCRCIKELAKPSFDCPIQSNEVFMNNWMFYPAFLVWYSLNMYITWRINIFVGYLFEIFKHRTCPRDQLADPNPSLQKWPICSKKKCSALNLFTKFANISEYWSIFREKKCN